MEQNQIPLFKKLIEHKEKNSISFHVPGHKNGMLLQGIYKDFTSLMEFDVTELSGLDDLHDPQEAIYAAQQLLTDLYRARKSYFLINGSTVGNLAMILASCKEGDTVLVQRNCHKSILNGLMLANVKPIFISPEINNDHSMPSKIAPELVKRALEHYPNIKACIFTYPDYYGKTYDLKRIIKYAHKYDAVVLVDEAHGPHFQLGFPFPLSALDLGADIVVQSAHKMLPAMTMGSYFHINSGRINREKVEFYLSALQSSSPSYPIMSSLDIARYYLANISERDISYTLEKRQAFVEKLSAIPWLHVEPIEVGQDPLKMLISHEKWTGYQLQKVLEDHGIYPEMADPFQVLFTLPLLKQDMAFPYEEAASIIKKINFKAEMEQRLFTSIDGQENITELSLSYKDMSYMTVEAISIDEAVGRIAAKMIIPYPPGIPLLLPGEKITNIHIQRLKEYLRTGARFQGGGERLREEYLDVFISN